MNFGAVGGLLYFFSLLIAAVMVSFFVFSYLAHCFHVVVQTTASGGDDVIWSNEPFMDRLGAAVQFLYMLFVAPVPGAFVAVLLRPSFPREERWQLLPAGSLLSIWLLF